MLVHAACVQVTHKGMGVDPATLTDEKREFLKGSSLYMPIVAKPAPLLLPMDERDENDELLNDEDGDLFGDDADDAGGEGAATAR